MSDVRRSHRQHRSACEDGRLADSGLDRRRRLRSPGVCVSSFADRLRGIVKPRGDERDTSGADSFTRSAADPSGPRDAAEILSGEWRESHGRKFLVIDRKYTPGYRHGRVSIADCLPPWDRFDVLGGAPGKSLFLDLETTGLAGGAG